VAASRHSDVGRAGELAAGWFLRKLGYRILRRNYRLGHDEIDLIVRDGDEVVFVEVKTRSSRTWGDPQIAVTPAKQRKVARAAVAFVEKNRLRERPLLFDVVAGLVEEGCEPEIEHYKNAFPLPRNRDR